MMLDEAQLNALTPEDRRKYMAFEQLFGSTGWKYVVALAKHNAAEAVQRAAFADNWAANRIAIGNGAAWDAISKLEEQTEATYQLKLQELEKAAEIVRITEESQYE